MSALPEPCKPSLAACDIAASFLVNADVAALFLSGTATGADADGQLVHNLFYAVCFPGVFFYRRPDAFCRRPAFERHNIVFNPDIDMLSLACISDLNFCVDSLYNSGIGNFRAVGFFVSAVFKLSPPVRAKVPILKISISEKTAANVLQFNLFVIFGSPVI